MTAVHVGASRGENLKAAANALGEDRSTASQAKDDIWIESNNTTEDNQDEEEAIANPASKEGVKKHG